MTKMAKMAKSLIDWNWSFCRKDDWLVVRFSDDLIFEVRCSMLIDLLERW